MADECVRGAVRNINIPHQQWNIGRQWRGHIRKRTDKFIEIKFGSSVSRREKKMPRKDPLVSSFWDPKGRISSFPENFSAWPASFWEVTKWSTRVFPHSQMIQCNGRFDRNHPELMFVCAVRSQHNSLKCDLNVSCSAWSVDFFFLFFSFFCGAAFEIKFLQRVCVAVNCCIGHSVVLSVRLDRAEAFAGNLWSWNQTG